MTVGTDTNTDVWRTIYAAGKNDLVYPNDNFIRIFLRLFSGEKQPLRMLDYGFGTGANLIHVAQSGHITAGIEISQHALDIAERRLKERGLSSELLLSPPGAPLPFADNSFDIVMSWQVIYYNDWDGIRKIVKEFERVAKPDGKIIVATAAPGDISHQMSDAAVDGTFISGVPGQEGCKLVILQESDLPTLFAGPNLEIGEFLFHYGNSTSRHWVLTYSPP